MIEIQTIPGKGRGIVTTARVFVGQVLEEAAFIPLTDHGREEQRGTELGPYPFVDPDQYVPGGLCKAMLVLGLMTLVNHSDTPNSMVIWRDGYARLIPIRTLRAGEEVTICYTDIQEYDRSTWHDPPAQSDSPNGGPRVSG